MEPNTSSASDVKVKVAEKEISADHLISFSAEADLGQPDMCMIAIRNETNKYSNEIDLTDNVEITASGTAVFKGEVVGLEPIYTAKGENSLIVRAFNKMHRMLRSMQSQTFVDQSDEEIVKRIVQQHGLTSDCGTDATTKHEHIYQHNQTDLEFLRIRAARLGYDIWVEDDKTLHFDAPNRSSGPVVTLEYKDAESASGLFLKYFAPRLSSRRAIKTAKVQGWDPKKKEAIIGTSDATKSGLGTDYAYAMADKFKATPIFEVDQPVANVEEANKIAEGKVRSANMSYITGSGECRGSPEIKLAKVIEIKVNPDGQDRFSGKYLVVGVTHKYTPQKGNDGGGYITGFRVERDATDAAAKGPSGPGSSGPGSSGPGGT